MDGNPRAPRETPNGTRSRPSNESRRPPGAPGGAPGGAPSSVSSSSTTRSRAEEFEDERRRIVGSCFNKTDTDGALLESYITHIRINENSQYPQSPAPPNATSNSKKSRIIIVSVMKDRSVKINKARENGNKTFSIGKKWEMYDVSQIENFVTMNPTDEKEALMKKWAGDVGFTVTIVKPYYWEAPTPKEKQYFIGSIVKIFHKYTFSVGYPALSGFTVSEMSSLTNGRPYLATTDAYSAFLAEWKKLMERNRIHREKGEESEQLQFHPADTPEYKEAFKRSHATSGYRPRTNAEDDQSRPRRPPPLQPQQSPGSVPPLRGARPPSRPSTGDESRAPSNGPGRGPPGSQPFPGQISKSPMEPPARARPSRDDLNGQGLQTRPSRENMQMPRPRPSLEPIPALPAQSQRLTPQSSRSDLGRRPTTPDSTIPGAIPPSLSPGRPPPAEDARSQRSQTSLDNSAGDRAGPGSSAYPRKQNGHPSPNRRDPSPSGRRPGTGQSNNSFSSIRYDDPAIQSPIQPLPTRKRPPLESAQSQQSQQSQRSLKSQESEGDRFHTPSQSPAPPRDGMPPPPRRRERPPPASDERPVRSRRGLLGSSENLQNSPFPSSQSPPPTSPLPQIPIAPKDSTPPPQDAPPALEAPAPVEPTPVEPPPAETPPAETMPTETMPTETMPTETMPTETASAEAIPEVDTKSEPPAPSADGAEATDRRGISAITKKASKPDAASAFRKAAAAAGAFKPRAGGAAAKLFAKQSEPSDEADGISGVFVPQRPTPKEEAEKKIEDDPKSDTDGAAKERPSIDTEVIPSLTVSSPLSPAPVATASQVEDRPRSRSPSPEKAAIKTESEAEVRRKKRRSNQQIMNISKLGIDPSVLDDRGLEFESLLSEFGWGSSDLSVKNIESLEVDIRREIARVEAGSWLNHLEQKDDRVEAVEKMLDRAIAECDELEGLLTLYNVELGSLNDDITFIEAQSQGLQVQTANQRLLEHELQQLVDTISITPDQLEALRRAPIGKVNGLKAIESSLALLYKALVTIDPAFAEGSRANANDLNKITGRSGFGDSEMASMQALQEKKQRYMNEAYLFLDRLKKHMEITFGAAFLQTRDALANIDKTSTPSTAANVEAHNAGRQQLWMLSPVVLFAKEVDLASWNAMLRMYQAPASQTYQDEVRDTILAWKRQARKPTGEEQDLLFTAQEKEQESTIGAARKLTVKRSQTLARGLRTASGEKDGKMNKTQDGKLYAFDVFAKILEDIGPIFLTEQNFVTEFFHATSTDAVDFAEAVSVVPPNDRRGPNLWLRRQFEADRAMAKRVAEVMEDIFSFWPTEMQNLVEWALKSDPLQGVGILCAVDRKLLDMEDSNQDFLMRNLQKIHERLTGLFSRFVDEQIRAIEDTKVKIKKRKGVIGFMKTFPHFSIAIENMLPPTDEHEQLEIRRMVDEAYQKINKAMFESLKVIAKESPTVMASQGQSDPEDKEALNYHILLIENMNHYVEEVDARADFVLVEWRSKAQDEMKEHMDLYVDAVIRRPLGKLLEFIESTETLLSQPGASPQSIANRSSHSRSVFKKLVHAHDAKEVRKGIEALKKRVDKHFGDADDQSISRDLVWKVLKACEKKYGEIHDRAVRINQDVYTGEVEIDWGASEVAAAFRR